MKALISLTVLRLETLCAGADTVTSASSFVRWLMAIAEHTQRIGLIVPVTPVAATYDAELFRLRKDDCLFALPVMSGFLRIFLRAPRVTLALLRARRFSPTLLCRVPEHGNALVLPIAWILRYRIICWVVGHRGQQEASMRSRPGFVLVRTAATALSRVTGAIETWILRRVPIIVNGRTSDLQHRVRMNPRILEVVSSAIRDRDIPPFREPRTAPQVRLLYVGRVAPGKGLSTLLDAVRRLEASSSFDAEIRIVGWDAHGERRRLEEQVWRINLRTRVSFVPAEPFGPSLFRHYQDADIFVLPSEAEGTPRVLVEAMAFSVPIVASDVGGVRTQIVNGVTGILVPPRDAIQLADAILFLSRDAAMRRTIALAAWRCARENTVDRLASKMARFIAQVDR